MSAPTCTGAAGHVYDAMGDCEAADCPVHGTPGPAEDEPADCRACLGTGMGAVRRENSQCLTCGGRGYLSARARAWRPGADVDPEDLS